MFTDAVVDVKLWRHKISEIDQRVSFKIEVKAIILHSVASTEPIF